MLRSPIEQTTLGPNVAYAPSTQHGLWTRLHQSLPYRYIVDDLRVTLCRSQILTGLLRLYHAKSPRLGTISQHQTAQGNNKGVGREQHYIDPTAVCPRTMRDRTTNNTSTNTYFTHRRQHRRVYFTPSIFPNNHGDFRLGLNISPFADLPPRLKVIAVHRPCRLGFKILPFTDPVACAKTQCRSSPLAAYILVSRLVAPAACV